jgi:3-hydroxybutyryl-CoA dehydrogenase
VGPKNIKNVGVIGAGFMGTQIGLQCALHGYNVRIIDVSETMLGQAVQVCGQELEKRIDKQQITEEDKESTLSRISFTDEMKEGASTADLVIEAVNERLGLKREVFAQLDEICPAHTILATNSSSIRISRIEDATNRLDKVLNMHFYGTILQDTIVELMRGTKTSDETIETVYQFAHSINILPLIVQKESTGFLYNRVWRAIKKECLRVVADGVASHEDVDRAWMILMGRAVGPFGMMDRVGLDVVRDIEMVYYGESGDESDAPPQFLLDKIERGELGVKTGKGFYNYPNPAFQDPVWLRPGK